jgi:hypothetical protein
VQQAANVAPKNNGKLTPDEITEKATLMTSVYADIFHQLQASGLEPAQAQPAAATIFIQIRKVIFNQYGTFFPSLKHGWGFTAPQI